MILDDIGSVQQDRDEREVLFTFLAERYERPSVLLTSNLVFRPWDRIFQDPMTTTAAIDRVVHHAVIGELTGRRIREEEAQARHGSKLVTTTTTSTTTTPDETHQPMGKSNRRSWGDVVDVRHASPAGARDESAARP